MVSKEVSDYVALAKQQGMPDETLAFILREQGWSHKKVSEAVADHYVKAIGRAAPARTGPRESAGIDMFLYLFSGGMAITWAASLSILISSWINGPNEYGYSSGAFNDSVAMFFLAAPIYLLAMVVINRRLKRRVAVLDDWVRHYSTGILLATGAGAIFFQAVSAFMSLLNGRNTPSEVGLNFLVVLIIVGGLMAYYANWLKWELPPEDGHVAQS